MVLTATHTCFCHLLVIYAIEVPSGITPNQEQNALSLPYYIIRSSSAAEKKHAAGSSDAVPLLSMSISVPSGL